MALKDMIFGKLIFVFLGLVMACDILAPSYSPAYSIEPRVDRIEFWKCDDRFCEISESGEGFLLIEEKGDVAFIDGGSAADGPALYIQKSSGRILAWCGGALMLASEEERMKCSFEYWEGKL